MNDIVETRCIPYHQAQAINTILNVRFKTLCIVSLLFQRYPSTVIRVRAVQLHCFGEDLVEEENIKPIPATSF